MQMMCVKVLFSGGNTKVEIPRPSYLAGEFTLTALCFTH